MPTYNGGEIVLSAKETELFQKRLQNPDREMLNKRDAFWGEIERTLCIEEAEDGVYISFVEEPIYFSITSTDTYSLSSTKNI